MMRECSVKGQGSVSQQKLDFLSRLQWKINR